MTDRPAPPEHALTAPARAWFEELRDRLCAAFEAIEDELSSGPHAGMPPGALRPHRLGPAGRAAAA
jgi:coproporphyrinogen III oxidase